MASKTRREDTARREETTSHTSGFPARQGMYNPAFEKDACGLAMVATLRGQACPRQWRDASTKLLFVPERPYFL